MERLGVDVVHVSETVHDAFMLVTLALAHTSRIIVRTSMVVAFPRSPMVTAYAAWDLAKYSDGRFQLGVASQVRGNIVGRYSSQWSEPVVRLRDYIGSLRAIFDSFQTGTALAYTGPCYQFDRLQPYFNPGPIDSGAPLIFSGGVNRRMCTMAGEVSDGFVCHPTSSHPDIVAARIRPWLADGAASAHRAIPAIVVNPQVITGATEAELNVARERRRTELAFLYSTPAYRPQLEILGFGALAQQLNELARRSEWSDMAQLLTDDVLNAIVPQGTYQQIPAIVQSWYGGRCDGVCLPVPADGADDEFANLVQRTKEL